MTKSARMVDTNKIERATPRPIGPVLTIEAALYVLLAALGGALRLVNLGAAPLSATEAGQALAAWQGTTLPAGGSPLMYNLNQLLAALTGPALGDAGPRLGAALLGTLLVLTPWLYRRPLGRYGALAASLLLAISPVITTAARSLTGPLAATIALAALGFALRYAETLRPRHAYAAAAAGGLLPLCGVGLWSVLIPIGLAGMIGYRQLRREVGGLLAQMPLSVRRTAVWTGVAALAAGSTALLLSPASVRFVPESLTAWLAAWSGFDTVGALQLVQTLALYEPLILLAGGAGLVVAWRRPAAVTRLLSGWAVGALLIVLLQPGRQVFDLALALTPLAMLGGLAVQALAEALAARGRWPLEGTLWLIMAPLIGYLLVTISSYAAGRGPASAQVLGQPLSPAASFLMLAVLLVLIVGAVFTLAIGFGPVWRAGAVALLVTLAAAGVGNTWSATQLRAGDPRELMWQPAATSPDVHALVQAAEAASLRATGQRARATINVVGAQIDPVLAWYLREFDRRRFLPADDGTADIVITPEGVQPVGPTAYIGALFVRQATWSFTGLSEADALRWWLYREAGEPPATERVIVWVKPAS